MAVFCQYAARVLLLWPGKAHTRARTPPLTLCVQVEASMMEIYNEKMRDLLDPSKSDKLKIRETKMLGVYVDQLTNVRGAAARAADRRAGCCRAVGRTGAAWLRAQLA